MNNLIDGRVMLMLMHEELCYDIACRDCSMCNEDGGCRVEEWIDKFQSADAESVVHGEWIFRREFVEDTPFTGYRCSNCNYWEGMGAWNFCPHCGARMKGADDE